ncbi:MAG: outer membrane beta-barrel protein [Bacteroidetes bacterium]|nr:outer membrane beta-barrel protein [Bacteroidota bacterium]
MLQFPILLEFNIGRKPSKSFHIAAGVIGQFMISSKTKQKFEISGNEFTKIRKDSYNMSPFQVKAHASVGYSNFTVFSEYNITPLFSSGKGPEVYPFVIGVRLIPFGN